MAQTPESSLQSAELFGLAFLKRNSENEITSFVPTRSTPEGSADFAARGPFALGLLFGPRHRAL